MTQHEDGFEMVTERLKAVENVEVADAIDLDAVAAPAKSDSILPTLVTRRANTIEKQPIRWLWPGRIALGKLSLIAGDPGLGKSQLTLDFAARVSRGDAWPVDGTYAPQGAVLIVSAEDDASDTIVPRLEAADADLSRILIADAVRDPDLPEGRQLSLARDLRLLEEAMPADCVLVIIDPVSAYLGGTDSHSNAELRELLTPIAKLAQRQRVSILAVSHLNKAGGQRSQYRVTGSIAFTAAPRAVYMVVEDQGDPKRRMMLPLKNNLGDDQTGLAYRIQSKGDIPYIEWEPDLVTVSVDDVMGSNEDRTAMDDAVDWLKDALEMEPVPVKALQKEARDAGHAWATVKRAKNTLGVQSDKSGFGHKGEWRWRLPSLSGSSLETKNDEPLSTLGGGPIPAGFSGSENTKDAKGLKDHGIGDYEPVCPSCDDEGCRWCQHDL